jgi:hypothetical protein
MDKNIQLALPIDEISGKKVVSEFDGGLLSSDGGALLLPEAEKFSGIIHRLASCFRFDHRDQQRINHTQEDLLRQRVYQIACNYEDANDSNSLREDPVFKMACGRLPQEGKNLGSQPTISRFENTPSRSILYRMGLAMIDAFVQSYASVPSAIILDIDDTADPTHGAQQMSMFNSYYDTHCYLPLHIYDGRTGKLVLTVLRPGKRAKGKEIVAILKRVVRRIRAQWPTVEIVLRGDSHFSPPEVQSWADALDNVHFILGLTGNTILRQKGKELMEHAEALFKLSQEKVRLFGQFTYKASTWDKEQRVIMKAEVTKDGSNPRFVVTSLDSSRASFIYDETYCGRGQMENFIKDHKTHLHSDRTSCCSFQANQFRLFLHSAAYWLLYTIRESGLKGTDLARAQFNTIQNKVLKIGIRVEEMITRIKLHLPTSYPFKDLLRRLIKNLSLAVT